MNFRNDVLRKLRERTSKNPRFSTYMYASTAVGEPKTGGSDHNYNALPTTSSRRQGRLTCRQLQKFKRLNLSQPSVDPILEDVGAVGKHRSERNPRRLRELPSVKGTVTLH